MEKQKNEKINRDKNVQLTYEPPKAIYVPLKIEERMMYCGKSAASPGIPCTFGCK
jgi:hypothetical protein